jgi:hypothetical protein
MDLSQIHAAATAAALAEDTQRYGGFVYFLAYTNAPRRPIYVGSTKSPSTRWNTRAGNFILVVVSRHDTRAEAYEAEWRLIDRWKRRGFCEENRGREGGSRRWELYCEGMRAHGGWDRTWRKEA